ncbi:hypothetical protein ACQE98_11330 [Ornithinimicrobium sp. W1679]
MTGGESVREVDFPYSRLITAENAAEGYGDMSYEEGFLQLWGLDDD